MGNRLYVGNLSFHTNEDTLRDAFGQFGDVIEVRIVTDRESGRSRGFAFVSMADSQSASQATSQLNGVQVDGRDLRVSEAEERQQGGGGRSFGGGGGGGRSFGGGGGGRGRSF
jgi:cold-inducible RNA-binding protein